MKQTVAIVASILGGVLLAGCGPTNAAGPDAGPPFDIKTAFPADQAITGWEQDTTLDSTTGPVVYATAKAVDDSDIDGDVVPFTDVGFSQLAREHFKSEAYTLDLRVWQMNADTKGKTIYESILLTSRYKIITFTDQAIGTAGRSGNSGTMWRVNSYKGAYFVEAMLSLSEEPDTAGRDDAIKFVKYAVEKLP
ncbi:MAG: hypothetical protein QM765_10645 [Myxococcales bacterium]